MNANEINAHLAERVKQVLAMREKRAAKIGDGPDPVKDMVARLDTVPIPPPRRGEAGYGEARNTVNLAFILLTDELAKADVNVDDDLELQKLMMRTSVLMDMFDNPGVA